MASDLTTVAFIYKKKYSDRQVQTITERDHPRWARLAKKGGFTGTSFAYVVRTGNPQGISGTFTDAQDGAETSKGEQLLATRKPKFAVIKLDGEAIAASEGNDGAFYDLVTMETDGKLQEMGDTFAFDAYRSGNGMRGRRASISGNIITLSVADDARNFKRGMTLIASTSITGSAPRSGTAKVTGVSEKQGKVTVDNAAGITSFSDNDYLFRKGDPGTCMEGLAVTTPLTEPTAGDSFRGIDRSVDPARLAGSRVDDISTTIEENMGLGAVLCAQVGKQHTPTEGYLNPIKFFEVARRLGAKVMYDSNQRTAKYGFQYIEIATATGVMQVYSDPDCPTTLGYGERSEFDYILHLKGLPHIVKSDGLASLRMAAANGIEGRAASWCNYIQEDPAAHFVINTSSS